MSAGTIVDCEGIRGGLCVSLGVSTWMGAGSMGGGKWPDSTRDRETSLGLA